VPKGRVMLAVAIIAIMAALAAGCGGGGGPAPILPATRPVKHLIVVVGENRSFDNVFATYQPPDPGQHVWNLLSQGIIDASGKPGPKFSLARQQQATDTVAYELSPKLTGPFADLPQPSTTLSALPASPCVLTSFLFPKTPLCTDPGLEPAQQVLLSTGGTGQTFYFPSLGLFPVPDCRYPSDLSNGPFSLVGASQLNGCGPPLLIPAIVPTQYAGNTGDPVHRFFQMWQQNDCSEPHINASNPSGCNKDLYAWVATSAGWQITMDGKPPADDQGTFQGGIAMGFYNMAAGDYPFFRSLAQSYAINDNYHQFAMGGSGPNSQAIETADVFYFTDKNGNPATAPPNLIENPNPQPGSNNFYIQDHPDPGDLGSTSSGGLVNCSDLTAPGVRTIHDYLNSLPYTPFNNGNCAANVFYQVDNEYPSFDAQGAPVVKSNAFPNGPDFAIGPQTIPTIGDALSARRISWKYYGEGVTVADRNPPLNQLYCAICNPFQYTRSIMTTTLKDNLQDLDSFFSDLKTGNLPAVSFIKPDTLVDSHPGSSTPPLFEAFCQKIINMVKSNDKLWKSAAILITFDEGGGWYDSGYIQPIDFFGDGPRTVMIAVSPFSRRGFVDHTYSDHASIAKFIERNWSLKPLSTRSRDNLPNPTAGPGRPYFPTNSPAIGDLTDMFDFNR
jgi:phospholipase C